MSVIGQFRVLDDPDQFFWLRGFTDMRARADGLNAFYGGSIWKAHRDAANATMVDSDNVLLLRPARPLSGFALSGSDRASIGSKEPSDKLYVANICYTRDPAQDEIVSYFEHAIMPLIARAGVSVSAHFVTEQSPNNYPSLPVREGENAFVWFTAFSGVATYSRYIDALSHSLQWQSVYNEFASRLCAPVEIKKLAPSARSLLR